MGEELNASYCRLQRFDLDGLEDVVGCQARWLEEVQQKLNWDGEEIETKKFAGQNKPVLAEWLAEATDIMCRQRDYMSDMKEMIELLKTEAIGDKEAVIRLQNEVLQSKEEQLKSLRAAVQTTVQDTVQTEMRSYGEVLKSSTPAAISPATFKKVVKDVMKDEDRSKNVIVFGLAEEDGEQLNEKVGNVFVEIGEKPPLAAVRIGRRPETGTVCRPVKVTLTSSTAVQQILTRARFLKQQERLKSVYVSPDRTPAERSARRLLVEERKKKAAEEPGRNHFIKEGKVCSVDKT